MAHKYVESVRKMQKYNSFLQIRGDNKGRRVHDGYVVTEYGIVGVMADFTQERGYTRLTFFWDNCIFVREFSERLTPIQAGTAARSFAEETARSGEFRERLAEAANGMAAAGAFLSAHAEPPSNA